ncbi:FAD-dependent oxidoreductase [Amycolatopsis sp. cg13]|uniref:glycerol-3-phosphate dehydrogenase/oxidase n=1 Tax=Amycolatopsis sp. cg13 TaxID=3238807 RepID=UPI003526869E
MFTLPSRRPNAVAARATLSAPLRLDRRAALTDLETGTFDVLVIGGGVTGAYTALDAVSRGLKVALVERDDFASGTSSKSSKMVHGGLRYIEQGNLDLVRHSLLERQRFRRNAPHLVQRLPFLFPILAKDGVFDARIAKAFESLLWTYDLAGGWRIGKLHQRLTVDEVLSHAPTLRAENLKGGLMYYDSRADDARLTLAIVRSAARHGAVVVNGAEVTGLRTAGGRVTGATVLADGEEIDIRARVVVNATGVWADRVEGMADHGHQPQVRPAKGVHIVLPWSKIRNDCTVTVPIPGRARRATCTRWGDVVVVGTTDTDYTGSTDDVHCTREEMDFLLEGAQIAFDTKLDASDVLGSYAGLRPLVGGKEGATLDMRRDHHITVSAGMVTVTGGKLTTSRHMGELVVDKALGLLGRKAKCRTKNLPLIGGAGYDAEATAATGGVAAHLGGRYGTEARFVSALVDENPELGEPLIEGQPFLKAEVVFAARSEMARSVDDVLSRRTRLRLFARDASVAAAPLVGELLGAELGLSPETVAAQVEQYRADVAREKSILFGDNLLGANA